MEGDTTAGAHTQQGPDGATRLPTSTAASASAGEAQYRSGAMADLGSRRLTSGSTVRNEYATAGGHADAGAAEPDSRCAARPSIAWAAPSGPQPARVDRSPEAPSILLHQPARVDEFGASAGHGGTLAPAPRECHEEPLGVGLEEADSAARPALIGAADSLPLPEDEDYEPSEPSSATGVAREAGPDHQASPLDEGLQCHSPASAEEAQGAIIWPGRPSATAVATRSEATYPSDGAAAVASAAQATQVATPAGAAPGGVTVWNWPQATVRTVEPESAFAPPATVLQNEAGSLVMPHTCRYVLPPAPAPPPPAQPALPLEQRLTSPGGTYQQAPALPGTTSAATTATIAQANPSPDDPVLTSGMVVIHRLPQETADTAASATDPPAKNMDLPAKRRLLAELMESLTGRARQAEQALGGERRANGAMCATLEVLQGQNVVLQQQLAWASAYANGCWQLVDNNGTMMAAAPAPSQGVQFPVGGVPQRAGPTATGHGETALC